MFGERISTAWTSALRDLRHAGAPFLLRRLGRQALGPVCTWRTLCFFERDLTRPLPEFRPRIPIEVRIASAEDLERFRDTFARVGARGDALATWRDRGDLCFIGVMEGQLVHFMWLTLAPAWLPNIGATVRVEPGEGVVYYSYTAPAARGNGVQPAVANFMIAHEKKLGLVRHFYFVLRDNYAGVRITAGTHAGQAAALARIIRCWSVAGLPGVVLTGLDTPGRPYLDLPAEARVHRLGRGRVWLPSQRFDPGLF
jgi:ribosomal protein S18 acetylase RimI-like enzyme